MCIRDRNASAQDAIYTSESIAPGWTKLSFDAPEPSTYTLAKYAPAGNGNVLDADGIIEDERSKLREGLKQAWLDKNSWFGKDMVMTRGAQAIHEQVVAEDGTGKLFEEQLGMHPIGRIGEPEEIGATAVFLASDGGAFANGADFRVDGGLTITPRMKPGAGSRSK